MTTNTYRKVPVHFSGQGGEFFLIWIVNILLSMVTLGIYSAWAKVRTKQYFYGNTSVNGQSFQYHATGMQILKGRLIAIIALLLFYALSSLFPVGLLITYPFFLLVVPYFINAGLRFNARMSSWRNVRFNFKGSYGSALKVFIGWPLLAVLTVGVLAPRAVQRAAKYLVTSHSWGEERFDFKALPSTYGTIIYGLCIGYIVSFVTLIAAGVAGNGVFIVIGYVAILGLAYSVKPLLFNVYWNHIRLKENGFVAKMSVGRYIWVLLSNSVVVAITLGLMYPWSKVRMARFTAESIHVVDAGSLDTIANVQIDKQSAIGEEIGEAFDVDVGFGV